YKIKMNKCVVSGMPYTLNNGTKKHAFNGSRGDYTPLKAIQICSNKGMTNKYLKKEGVSIPEGKSFTNAEKDEDLIAYSNQLGYPLVLKPIAVEGGAGVITNICSEYDMNKIIRT